jgi:hypothetical protein
MTAAYATLIALTLTLVLDSACSASVNTQEEGVVQVGRGLACRRDNQTGPPNYLIKDIGKPGVPHLRKADVAVLRRIEQYIHRSTLRFVYLNNKSDRRFVVFNVSVRGMCDPSTPPLIVLNGSCSEYYSPFYRMFSTGAADGCFNPPRPWVANDGGSGSTSWSTQLHDY